MAIHSATLCIDESNTDYLSQVASTQVDPQRVADAVEEICQLGCKMVLKKISILEAGESVNELRDLCYQGQQEVLAELKSIMSVYGNICRL